MVPLILNHKSSVNNSSVPKLKKTIVDPSRNQKNKVHPIKNSKPERSFQSRPVFHRLPMHSSIDQTFHHQQTRTQYQHL